MILPRPLRDILVQAWEKNYACCEHLELRRLADIVWPNADTVSVDDSDAAAALVR